MTATELKIRHEIVEAMRRMEALGLTQGTSGNVSVRRGDGFLISPSGVPPAALTPETIVALDGDGAAQPGQGKPSSEWRFHRDILAARAEVQAIIHKHSPHATALSMTRQPIPPAHYMVAAFGGDDVRCAGYALFGSQTLSDAAVTALEGRWACLLANHGAITLGETLDTALWRAVELETLARQYLLSLQAGGPVLLSTDEIAEALDAFADYGAGKAR